MKMFVYYQNPALNACVFQNNRLIVKEDEAVQVATVTLDKLKNMGYEFKNENNISDIAQTLFHAFNLRNDEFKVPEKYWKKAGHTSMSVGDFIIFRKEDVRENMTVLICGAAGWQKIDDMMAYRNARESAMRILEKLPVDIYMAIEEAIKKETAECDILDALAHLSYTKCENHCPDCGSDAIDWQDKDICDEAMYQTGKCKVCKHFFTEEYSYTKTVTDDVTNAETDADNKY